MPVTEESSSGSITLRELEILRALVATGKTTAAAHRLGISQPAVSRALSRLESRLDRQLFLRDGGRLLPMAEALAIDAELEPAFAALARIRERADQRALKPAVLRIAAPPTIAHRFLPGPVARFVRLHPNLRVSLDVLSSDMLVTQVAEGRIDLAFADVDTAHAGVRLEPYLTTEAVCLLPKGHDLAAKEEITPADLADEPFIALTRRHTARIAIDAVFDEAGIACRRVIETSTAVSAAEFVREGLGATLLNPFPVAARLGPDVVVRPFRPSIRFSASFLLPSSVHVTPAALGFMAHLRGEAVAFSSPVALPESA
jgi:DNA-binding transcriptional LysR family regulator